MNCDLVIISYNTRNLVDECIQSALSTAKALISDIIVVDNNSSDDTVEIISKKYPFVKIIQNDENLGYSKAVNQGAALCKSPMLLISNSDIIFLEEAIPNLLDLFYKDNTIGAAGVRQIYPNGKWQYSYGYFPNKRSALRNYLLIARFSTLLKKIKFNRFGIDEPLKDIDYADGGMLAVQNSAFKQVGGFDEDYFFYSEDMDFCFRMKKEGMRVVFFPDAKVVHLRGGSNKSENERLASLKAVLQSIIKFSKKHQSKEEILSYCNSQIFSGRLFELLFLPLSWLSSKLYDQMIYYRQTHRIWSEIKRKDL